MTQVIASGKPKDSWQSWSPARRLTIMVNSGMDWCASTLSFSIKVSPLHQEVPQIPADEIWQHRPLTLFCKHCLPAAVWQGYCTGGLLFRPSWPFLCSYKPKCRSHCHGTTQASFSLKQGEPGGDGNPGRAGLNLPNQGLSTVSE